MWVSDSNHNGQNCMNLNTLSQNPGDDGVIRRASRLANTIPGISRFPQGVLLAQHRVERLILESLSEYGNIEIQRNVKPMSIRYHRSEAESQGAHSVTVTIAQVRIQTSLCPVAISISNGVLKTNVQSKTIMSNGLDGKSAEEEVIRAKYVIGCDGAHSWTRAQLGFHMEGEQSDYIWGVIGKLSMRYRRNGKLDNES